MTPPEEPESRRTVLCSDKTARRTPEAGCRFGTGECQEYGRARGFAEVLTPGAGGLDPWRGPLDPRTKRLTPWVKPFAS